MEQILHLQRLEEKKKKNSNYFLFNMYRTIHHMEKLQIDLHLQVAFVMTY